MIQHTQNTIRFCKNVPKEKLQELISGALVPGKDEHARFDIRFLLPMPGNDQSCLPQAHGFIRGLGKP